MKRRLVIGAVIVGGLLVAAAAALALGFGSLGEWVIRSRVLPSVRHRLGRDVTVARIEVKHGVVVFEDVIVGGGKAGLPPVITVDRVRADYDWWEAIKGDIRVTQVRVTGLSTNVVRRADGKSNVGDLISRVRARGAASETSGKGGRGLFPDEIIVEEASLSFRDARDGISATADMAATLRRGEPARASLSNVVVKTQFGPGARAAQVGVTAKPSAPVKTARIEVKGGEISLWPGLALTGVTGTIAPDRGASDAGPALDIALSGGYGGVDETLWTADGAIDPGAREAHLKITAEQFSLERLRPILEGSPIIDFEDTTVDAELSINATAGDVTIAGNLGIAELSVFHPMLAEKPVPDLDLRAEFSAAFDRAARQLSVTRASVMSRGVKLAIDGFLRMPGGLDPDTGLRRTAPRLAAHLVLEPVPCQVALRAIPRQLASHLRGFALKGELDADLTLDIDWEVLDATVLDGHIGIFECKALRAPPRVSAERLMEPFTQRVPISEDEQLRFRIGPKNPDFVPYEEISPHLINAVITSEDSDFFEHQGFVPRAFRTALVRDLKAGYFKYGASSITMQMVKNVLLNREKTLSRKLQELFLTWYVETELEKERILEIYFNAIEYGPGLYGIGPASQRYFGKHPSLLTPVEAVFLSTILPAPKRRYRQYCTGEPARWTLDKIQRRLDLMHERGRLTDIELQFAKITPLLFARDDLKSERRCLRMVREALENKESTSPMVD